MGTVDPQELRMRRRRSSSSSVRKSFELGTRPSLGQGGGGGGGGSGLRPSGELGRKGSGTGIGGGKG